MSVLPNGDNKGLNREGMSSRWCGSGSPLGQVAFSRLVVRFEVDPERGGDASPEGESAGSVGANASLSAEQTMDMAGRVAVSVCELMWRDAQLMERFEQMFARFGHQV